MVLQNLRSSEIIEIITISYGRKRRDKSKKTRHFRL